LNLISLVRLNFLSLPENLHLWKVFEESAACLRSYLSFPRLLVQFWIALSAHYCGRKTCCWIGWHTYWETFAVELQKLFHSSYSSALYDGDVEQVWPFQSCWKNWTNWKSCWTTRTRMNSRTSSTLNRRCQLCTWWFYIAEIRLVWVCYSHGSFWSPFRCFSMH